MPCMVWPAACTASWPLSVSALVWAARRAPSAAEAALLCTVLVISSMAEAVTARLLAWVWGALEQMMVAGSDLLHRLLQLQYLAAHVLHHGAQVHAELE